MIPSPVFRGWLLRVLDVRSGPRIPRRRALVISIRGVDTKQDQD